MGPFLSGLHTATDLSTTVSYPDPTCNVETCKAARLDLQYPEQIPENAPTTGAVLIHHATSFDDNDLLNQVPNPPVRRALMSARSVPTTGLEPNEMETKEERLYYKESAG